MNRNKRLGLFGAYMGYSLVELVLLLLIILILGIITIPRIIQINQKESEAQFAAVMEQYKEAVNIAHKKWYLMDYAPNISDGGSQIVMSEAGWPKNTLQSDHVPLTADDINDRSSIKLWFAMLKDKALKITGRTIQPTSGWYGSEDIGSTFKYTFYHSGRTRTFIYDWNTGDVTRLTQ